MHYCLPEVHALHGMRKQRQEWRQTLTPDYALGLRRISIPSCLGLPNAPPPGSSLCRQGRVPCERALSSVCWKDAARLPRARMTGRPTQCSAVLRHEARHSRRAWGTQLQCFRCAGRNAPCMESTAQTSLQRAVRYVLILHSAFCSDPALCRVPQLELLSSKG